MPHLTVVRKHLQALLLAHTLNLLIEVNFQLIEVAGNGIELVAFFVSILWL